MLNTDIKYRTFLELAESESLAKGKFEDFVKEVLVVLAFELKVNRTSFWLYKSSKEAFENLCLYDINEDGFIKENAIWEKEYPKYYNFWITNHAMKVDVAENEPRLAELMEDYIIPNNINSAMGRQVWYNGILLGYILVEQSGKRRQWENSEEIHMHIALSYLIQAYNSKQWLSKYHPEKLSDGDLSEFVDKEKEEMRRKLTDHAFYASHNIRHPITTIMALVDLVKANWEDRENYEQLLNQLKIEAMHLDETIRVMSAKIELD